MITWDWLGGFFDGEGSVTLQQHHVWGSGISVDLPQSGPEGLTILTEIKQFLLENHIETNALYVIPPIGLSKKTPYRLKVNKRESVILLLSQLIPYLRIKKIKVQDYLRHIKVFPTLYGRGKLTWESRNKNKLLKGI